MELGWVDLEGVRGGDVTVESACLKVCEKTKLELMSFMAGAAFAAAAVSVAMDRTAKRRVLVVVI